jgi:type I restriction enzyme S subunit
MLVKLEDVCEFITDGTHQTPVYCNNGGFIFLSSKDVTKQKIDWDNAKRIPDDLHKQLSTRLRPRKNDILLAKNGTTGVAAIVDRDEIFDVYVSLAVLRPLATIFPKYLLYAVNSPYAKHQFNAGLKGIGVPNLHLSIIRQTQIKIHNFEAQHRIVAILDQVNDLISLRNQQLEQLDLLIKSRFSEIFKLKNYPLKTLKECSVFIDYRGHTPVVSDTGTIRMINAKSVGKGFFKYIDEYVSEETYNSWMHRGFGEPGDVLIVTEGHTFGNVCRIPKDLTKFALGQRVITIRGINNLINNVYLSSYMQLDEFFQKINKYKTGGTAQGIRSKDLITITIPIPPLALQNQFAAFVEEVEKEKATVKQSLEWLNTLKASLMQDYFG